MEPSSGPSEMPRRAAHGLDRATVEGRAVVKENPVYDLIGEGARVGDLFNIVGHESLVGLAGVDPKVAAINQDRYPCFHALK